jgi:type II secretory pathway pseudopilin PulG
MVVVAIVGILMATATLAYNVFRDKAKTVQAMADLKKIQLAIELLATDTEKWPGPNNVGETANMEVWDLNAANAGLVATSGAFPGWNGPYIASVPKDP